MSSNNNVIVGIVGVVIASVFWGSNFVVCKGYDNMPPDGVHFAFLMSLGILIVGFLTLFSSAMEDGDFVAVFSPLGLMGGAMWACGNFLTVPIIFHLGLGVGLCTWVGVNMMVAFVVGVFGLEGLGINLPAEELTRPICGIFGVLLAICGLILLAIVQPSEAEEGGVDNHEKETASAETAGITVTQFTPALMENDKLLQQQDQQEKQQSIQENLEPKLPQEITSNNNPYVSEEQTRMLQPLAVESGADHTHLGDNNDNNNNNGERGEESHELSRPMLVTKKKNTTLGLALAILAGVLYGFQFVPLAIWNAKITDNNGYIFDHKVPSDTIQSLRFFFSQYAGIFLMATLGFFAYGVVTKNHIQLVPAAATLPSILSGILWAIGCAGAMLATSGLGNAVGFPLACNGTFLVNSSWSVLYFKEIQGTRNLCLFGGAIFLLALSSILFSLSKA